MMKLLIRKIVKILTVLIVIASAAFWLSVLNTFQIRSLRQNDSFAMRHRVDGGEWSEWREAAKK